MTAEERQLLMDAADGVSVRLGAEFMGVSHGTYVARKDEALIKARRLLEKKGLMGSRDFAPAPEGLSPEQAVAVEAEKKAVVPVRNEAGELLGPNGEVSNLSERDWVTVRTPFFKRWFGDWEAVAKLKAIEATKPIRVKALSVSKGSAKLAYGRLQKAVAQDGRQIDFVRGKFGKLAGHQGHELLFRAIPQFGDLIRASTLAYSESETSPAKGSGIKYFHNYVAPTTIDGVKYYVRFTVQEIADGRNQMHSAFVSDAEIVEADNLSAPISNISTSAGGQKVGLDHKLRDWWHSVNPESVSKVVDENGEPRVVYHGTNQEFESFERDFLGDRTGDYNTRLGFFSTSDQSEARLYGGKIVSVFLKVNNPAQISDAKLAGLDEDTASEVKALQRDHDGVIASVEDIETGQETGESWFIAPDANQIKSTDNLGTFDETGRMNFAPTPEGFGEQSPLGLFSKAERVVVGLRQEKGTGEQFLSMLRKAGVKEAESVEVNHRWRSWCGRVARNLSRRCGGVPPSAAPRRQAIRRFLHRPHRRAIAP